MSWSVLEEIFDLFDLGLDPFFARGCSGAFAHLLKRLDENVADAPKHGFPEGSFDASPENILHPNGFVQNIPLHRDLKFETA